jgi:phosphoribosylaminoimidazolecarboxamide formyltransferase/IMP cyclohydrolase
MNIKRALISVSNKEGIVELAEFLQAKNIQIISTGGTYDLLTKNNIKAKKVAEITGFPEILDGRVKTLHPKIHAGILADSNNKEHLNQLKQHDIEKIDLVVINLYPFEEVLQKTSQEEDIIENIDIGGPAMVRASAKNYPSTIILTNPNQYKQFVEKFETIGVEQRKIYAFEAFSHTARYDSLIAEYFSSYFSAEQKSFPQNYSISGTKVSDLRYGENPHQKAALYSFAKNAPNSIISAKKLQGKELSFNNIIDADAAWELVSSFDNTKPVVGIIKHANPCGVAIASSQLEAFDKALKCDEVSSFGGIFVFNTEIEKETAEAISKRFLEVLIAPKISLEVLEILKKKKNLIILENPLKTIASSERVFKNINGGFILQDADNRQVLMEDLINATRSYPSKAEYDDLLFAFKVIKFVHSNAILLVKDGATIGIGAGQMSRVDAVKIAIQKAKASGFDLKGAVLASDAFFPFPDSINLIAEYGISSVIQPGGSIRDNEVIEACNKYDISMVFSGVRSFRH